MACFEKLSEHFFLKGNRKIPTQIQTRVVSLRFQNLTWDLWNMMKLSNVSVAMFVTPDSDKKPVD
jgi:hypothetical protein